MESINIINQKQTSPRIRSMIQNILGVHEAQSLCKCL